MKSWAWRQWAALLALSLAIFMMALDVTIATVALPTIQRSLRVMEPQRIIGAYVLSFGSMLVVGKACADRFGRRLVFSIGLLVFTLASIACGMAADGSIMIAARIVQGTGAAFMAHAGLVLLTNASRKEEHPWVLFVAGTSLGLGLASGPVFGGLITQHVGWHWIFLVNVPVAVLVWLTVNVSRIDARDLSSHPLDVYGLTSFSFGMAALIYALSRGSQDGVGHVPTAALLLGALLSFASFIWIERHCTDPMIDLRLFAQPAFSGASLAVLGLSVGYWSPCLYLSLYFDRILHLDGSDIGLMMLPFTVPMLIMIPLSAKVATLVMPRVQFSAGLMLIAVGDLMLSATVRDGDTAALALALATAGIGAGLINTRTSTEVKTMAAGGDASMASGIQATMRQLGYGIGIAVFGLVLEAASRQALKVSIVGDHAIVVRNAEALVQFEQGRTAITALTTLKDVTDAVVHGYEAMFVFAFLVTLASAVAVWLIMGRHPCSRARALRTSGMFD